MEKAKITPWVKDYVREIGNEAAGEAAKTAAKLERVMCLSIPKSHAKLLVHDEMIRDWPESHDNPKMSRSSTYHLASKISTKGM